jgi:hypothetical protein
MAGKRKWLYVVALLLVLPLGFVCIALIGAFSWGAFIHLGSSSEEPPARPPLSRIEVSLDYGNPREIFVTLGTGHGLVDTLDLGLFDGFSPQMTAEEAALQLGPPTGEWSDPFCRKSTPFYARPGGRVSLCRYPTEAGHRWDVVAYPSDDGHDRVFRDRRIVEQLSPWLRDEAVTVHVLRQIGWGGVTVKMRRDGIEWMVLGDREELDGAAEQGDAADGGQRSSGAPLPLRPLESN